MPLNLTAFFPLHDKGGQNTFWDAVVSYTERMDVPRAQNWEKRRHCQTSGEL